MHGQAVVDRRDVLHAAECVRRRPTVECVVNETFRVKRVQGNIVARRERMLLNWLCAHLPGFVTPDLLTMLSVLGGMIAIFGYVASRGVPGFLWVASLGIVLNWFGDSLDGSLARYRHIERPVYGYFLDHTVDAFCNFLIMVGLGFSRDVSMAAALYALIGYFLLCIYVFINNHVSGVFQLSFLWAGPTELRLMIVGVNTGMFFAPGAGFALGGSFVSLYDALMLLAGTVLTLIFVYRMILGIRELRDPARSGASAIAQSASMKASSSSK